MQISKYNASGNDFVIFHTFKELDRSKLAIKLCDRQDGVGADGLIVLLPHDKEDFKWQFYNNNGSIANMCGNGTRACSHYAFANGLARSKMSFLTGAGVITSTVNGNIVETLLTQPQKLSKPFKEEGKTWYFYDTGVPHLVTFVEDIDSFDLQIAAKMRYKYDANINFTTIEKNKLYVRTYERGVEAETLACGTGMAACFYSANQIGQIGDFAKVYPTSKEELELQISNEKLYFKGKVSKIFDTALDAF